MKRTVLKTLATVFLAIVGLLFTTAMYQFGKAFSANGNGSRFFLYLVSGPQNLCLIVWPLLFPFLPWTRIPKIALTVAILSILPPLWVCVVLWLEGVQDDMLTNIWRNARPVVYIFSVLFLLPSLIGLPTSLRGAILAIKDMRKVDAS